MRDYYGDLRRPSKTTYRFVVSKKKKEKKKRVRARREQEREQDRGNGTIMLRKTKQKIAKGIKILRMSRQYSKANSAMQVTKNR